MRVTTRSRLAALAAATENVERSARLLGASVELLKKVGARMESDDRMVYERAVVSTHAQLDEESFARAWEEGRAMSMEQAVEYALAES